MIRTLVVVLFVLSAPYFLSAQSQERDQYRMAQAYERSGDMRNASRVYQELYAASPQNEMYFQGVARTLQALDQLGGLFPIAEQHAKRTRNPETFVLAGVIASKLNKADQRDALWKQAREFGGSDESILVILGRAQQGLFLFNDALLTFREAREKNGSTSAYQEELIVCYIALGMVDEAVNESLADFTDEQDLPIVIRRLSAILANDKAAIVLTQRLSPETTSRPMLRLALWFFRQQKNWTKAMAAATALDELNQAKGAEVLSFADGARIDEQYDVAITAYKYVLDKSKDVRLQTSAAYGAVRALEQNLRSNKITPSEASQVVAAYDDVILRFQQHPIAADALYYSAVLLDDVVRNVDEAQRRLLRITSFWKGAPVYSDAALRLADIYLSLGFDAQATEQLTAALSAGLQQDKLDAVRFKLADIELYSGRDSLAQKTYLDISNTPGSASANDALDRLLLLSLRQDDSNAVNVIIRAEGLYARRKFASVVSMLSTSVENLRDKDLRDRAAFLAARASIANNDTLAAEPFLQSVLQHLPETIYGDQALWLLSFVEEKKHNVKAAIQMLESLLVYYPRSILVPDARDRVRRLRGDA